MFRYLNQQNVSIKCFIYHTSKLTYTKNNILQFLNYGFYLLLIEKQPHNLHLLYGMKTL